MSETLEQAQARVEPYRQQLAAMLERSEITKDLFFKGLMTLAYEYIKAGHPDEAAGLVMQVPSDYFLGAGKKQMEQDVEYFQRASATYRAFRECGLLLFAFPLGQQAQAKA